MSKTAMETSLNASGKYLERLVAAVHHAASEGAVVKWDDEIGGRQFDVTIRFSYGLHSYLTVIECKETASKVSVEKVDAFVTKAKDANANKAILVSSRGFQSGCFPVAERHGIKLLVLTETTSIPVANLLNEIRPGLCIYDVSFELADGTGRIELEDWGGRLTYLLRHSRLALPTGTVSPDQYLNEWQHCGPHLEMNRENPVFIALPEGTEVTIPLEQTAKVSALRFMCSIVEIHLVKGPVFDNYLMEALSKGVELTDENGKLYHSAKLLHVPLGFDTVIVPGKFYEIPTICSRYLCERIEGESVTWILVESYQHGSLMQRKIRQKLKNAVHYVEVTDARIIERLQALLAQFRAAHENKSTSS